MKTKKITTVIVIAMSLLTQNIFSQSIEGTKHDFSGSSWNTTGDKCIVCHIPHNADNTVQEAPLWNHRLTTAAYNVYSSRTMNAVVGQPDGTSKLCLSCHDGTIALDNFSGKNDGGNFIASSAKLGTDLSDDHPISFTYDAALAISDGGLFDPNSQQSDVTASGTIATDMLISGKMQCTSCHDVHNTSGEEKLLIKSNDRSSLCLTCHKK